MIILCEVSFDYRAHNKRWYYVKLSVSSFFASVEARSVVVVLLRALRFYCEIMMSFGALELWRVGRFNTLYLAIAD